MSNPTQPGLSPIPVNQAMVDKEGNQTPPWQGFFGALYTFGVQLGQSGPTSQRPTALLFIGRRYFDTTLNLPIWVKTVSPSVVWINASGGVV